MTVWGLIALIAFALAAHGTVPAPTRRSVPRKDHEARAVAPSPVPGNLEAHSAGKRGIGEYLAALVIWFFLFGWVWALIRRLLP